MDITRVCGTGFANGELILHTQVRLVTFPKIMLSAASEIVGNLSGVHTSDTIGPSAYLELQLSSTPIVSTDLTCRPLAAHSIDYWDQEVGRP